MQPSSYDLWRRLHSLFRIDISADFLISYSEGGSDDLGNGFGQSKMVSWA